MRQLLEGGRRLQGFKSRPKRDQLPPARLVHVNASPSLVVDSPEGPIVITGQALEGRITSIRIRLNPEKTAGLREPPPIQ